MDHLRGSVILNYRLLEKLGAGGFGAVYRARHEELGREVAIKVLRSDRASNAGIVDRFMREAQLICAIGHPAIVEIENAGRLPSGEPFYVMELVPGRSLAQRLVELGPLGARAAIAVFTPIAEALAAAHGKGIVHRDLKPHNIMVEEQGGQVVRVKLLDFGIAKVLTAGDASLTGEVLGSPAFMAPEQALSSRRATAASDVYSFAASLYNALTGQRPIEADGVPAILIAAQRDPHTPLAHHARGVPAALELAMARCLAKEPGERPASMAEAWAELRAGLEQASELALLVPFLPVEPMAATATSSPTGGTVLPSGRPPAEPTETPFADEVRSEPPPPPRRRWLALVALGALAVAAAVVVYLRDAGPRAEPNPGLALGADARATEEPGPAAPPPPVIDAAEPAPEIDPGPAAPAPEVDAGPAAPIDAGPSRSSRNRRSSTSPPPRPPTGAPPRPVDPYVGPAPATPPPLPPISCDRPSFAAVYQAATPSKTDVRAALTRLRACRMRGLIGDAEHNSIQAALVALL